MPIFEYQDGRGRIIEELSSSPKSKIIRNGVVYRRRSAPTRVAVTRRASPPSMKEDVLSYYKKLEEQSGSCWPSKYPKEAIKQTWENDHEPYYDRQ